MNSTIKTVDFLNEKVASLSKKVHETDVVTQKRLLAIESLLIDINFMLNRILLSQTNNDINLNT